VANYLVPYLEDLAYPGVEVTKDEQLVYEWCSVGGTAELIVELLLFLLCCS